MNHVDSCKVNRLRKGRQMIVTVEKGQLVIRIPMASDPQPSSSGKTLLVASSHGAMTTNAIDPATGKAIIVSINAYVKP
jgi:hypothetical protein